MNIQLLCTFINTLELNEKLEIIEKKYDVASDKIFVLHNSEDSNQLILTYNVRDIDLDDILPSTISVHRKKYTNTIYTINALNQLIVDLNDGILDKKYKINWSDYKNCILVTAHGKLKKIPTTVKEIIIIG